MQVILRANIGTLFSFSYSGGEPPTPTKTPTSPNFFLNSFQTPKQDSRFNGSFSPWTPTFPHATSPDLRTPSRLDFGVSSQETTKSSAAKNVEAEIASHVHHLSPNASLPLPPVEPSRQLSSSPNPSAASETKRRRLNITESSLTPLNTTFDPEACQSMNSAGSMQTPPPTSTSASRRKAQQAQVARLVKESAEKGRRMSFPVLTKGDSMEVSTSQVEESPQHSSSLQFSPEGFGFLSNGPATAPVYPQHKLFWDPEQNGDSMNVDFPMDDTFITFNTHKNLDSFGSGHNAGAIEFPTSPAFNLLGTRAENIAPFTSPSDIEPATRATSSITMTRKPSRGNGVNPSLLFSSPGRTTEASNMPSTSQQIQDDNLLPYAHQLRDAQMELEMQMSRKPKRKRGPETDSPAVKAALQTLRDDHAGTKRDAADDIHTSSDSQRPSSRISQRLGDKPKVDPETRTNERSRSQRHASVHQVPMHKRASVTLTIDASGRAKTETRVLADRGKSSGGQMDVDSDDENDSSSSSSTDVLVTSQTQSFAYPIKQKQPKLGRFTHQTRNHSQKSSYASTLGSTSNSYAVSDNTKRRLSSNLTTQSGVQHRLPRVPFNDHGRDEIESEAETIIDSEDDKGDAQTELKKVLQSRRTVGKKSSSDTRSRNLYEDHQTLRLPQSASSRPYFMTEAFTPSRPGYSQPYNNNTSPTTITDPGLATPSSSRSTIGSDSVRCLCHGSHDDGQLMIQW